MPVAEVDAGRVSGAAPGAAVRYRVHLDLATRSEAHQAELVARLKGFGAMPADVGQGDVPWEVPAGPEGNHFCVLRRS